jgi:fucose permease
MTQIKTTPKENTLLIPLLIVGILFFVIGFGVGISGFLTPFLKDALHLSVTQSYLVTAAIFSAFVIFGSPAGWVILHNLQRSKAQFKLLLSIESKYQEMQKFIQFNSNL